MNAPEQRLRLFTAVYLPEEWLAALAKIRSQLERAGGAEFKWVCEDLMHVTLVFLGDQDFADLDRISQVLERAAGAAPPFDLSLGRLGSFGPAHAMSVIWAGLTEMPPEMTRLHLAISDGLSKEGIRFDPKPLVPHITLARGRRPVNRDASIRVSAVMQKISVPPLSTRIHDFALVRSYLSPRGPSYKVLRTFPLEAQRA